MVRCWERFSATVVGQYSTQTTKHRFLHFFYYLEDLGITQGNHLAIIRISRYMFSLLFILTFSWLSLVSTLLPDTWCAPPMPILNPVTLCTRFLNFSLPVLSPLPPRYPFHCTLLCHSGPRNMWLSTKSWLGGCPVRQETLNQSSALSRDTGSWLSALEQALEVWKERRAKAFESIQCS